MLYSERDMPDQTGPSNDEQQLFNNAINAVSSPAPVAGQSASDPSGVTGVSSAISPSGNVGQKQDPPPEVVHDQVPEHTNDAVQLSHDIKQLDTTPEQVATESQRGSTNIFASLWSKLFPKKENADQVADPVGVLQADPDQALQASPLPQPEVPVDNPVGTPSVAEVSQQQEAPTQAQAPREQRAEQPGSFTQPQPFSPSNQPAGAETPAGMQQTSAPQAAVPPSPAQDVSFQSQPLPLQPAQPPSPFSVNVPVSEQAPSVQQPSSTTPPQPQWTTTQ